MSNTYFNQWSVQQNIVSPNKQRVQFNKKALCNIQLNTILQSTHRRTFLEYKMEHDSTKMG